MPADDSRQRLTANSTHTSTSDGGGVPQPHFAMTAYRAPAGQQPPQLLPVVDQERAADDGRYSEPSDSSNQPVTAASDISSATPVTEPGSCGSSARCATPSPTAMRSTAAPYAPNVSPDNASSVSTMSDARSTICVIVSSVF